MSDFLQTLIVRNNPNTSSAILQPRLPALFESLEPDNGPSLLTETIEAQMGAAQTTSMVGVHPETAARARHLADQPDPTLTQQPDRSNPAHENAARDRNAMEPSLPPETRSTRQLDPVVVHLDQPPALPERIQPEHALVASVPPQDTIGPAEYIKANPQQISQSATFVRPTTPSAPQVSKPVFTGQAQVKNMEPAEQGTTVYVHIGRIDVRAVTAPAPNQPVQRMPNPKPALSLDDYLKQRSEGKR